MPMTTLLLYSVTGICYPNIFQEPFVRVMHHVMKLSLIDSTMHIYIYIYIYILYLLAYLNQVISSQNATLKPN